MVWRRFCHFVPFFAEKLSEKLYDAKANVVKASRIRFINATELCKGKGNNAEAILDFFVSKSENDLGTGDVDRNITILAYMKMRDYWKNKKMALLDPVFIGQVTSNLLAITLSAAHTDSSLELPCTESQKKKREKRKKIVLRKHYSAAFTLTLVIPHIISTGKKCWDLGKRQARHLRGFFRINKNRNWHNRRSHSHLLNRRYRIMSGKNPSNGQSLAMFTYFSYRKQISARRTEYY